VAGVARAWLALVALTAPLVACGAGHAPKSPATSVRVEALGDRILLATAAARAEVLRAPCRFELYAAGSSEPVASERALGGLFYERGGARHELGAVRSVRSLPDGAELEVATSEGPPARLTLRWLTPRTLEVTLEPSEPATLAALGDRFALAPGERIYGLSERPRDSRVILPGRLEVPIEELVPVDAGTLDRRGEIVEMIVKPTVSLYAPFYQSSRGFGLAVDGTSAGSYDVGHAAPDELLFRFETGRSPESRRLRFQLFFGPEHSIILDEYTRLSGRPFVPPDWAFLHWRYRDELPLGPTAELDGARINAAVAEDLAQYERLGIPPGVYLFDRPWSPGASDGFYYSRFAWDEERLPEPRAMLGALRRRGYRVAVWVSAFACGTLPGDHGALAFERGLLAPGAQGPPNCGNEGNGNFVLDVTHPSVPAFLRERFEPFAAEWEIDAVKLDRGEEFIPSQASDVWADGRSGREVRNDYPRIQARIFHDALANVRGRDFAVLARAGYTGTQRFAIFWGGDITGSIGAGRGPGTDLGLRSAILAQLRAAFLGFPIWGSDVGGYYEFKDREVFARWIEFGAFSGIMNIGGKGNHAPWDMPTEPRYDEEMIAIYRRYTRLRVELQEYLVAAAAEAGATGLPIARPLVFFDRDDPRLGDVWDEYLFGPDLLVAPVWRTGERRREVVFPRGSWRSFWDESERYEGPSTATVEAPLDRIPVFVRGDAPRPGNY
jgi:alpha-glucosidase (family GH31 glycosyl hydrolase)